MDCPKTKLLNKLTACQMLSKMPLLPANSCRRHDSVKFDFIIAKFLASDVMC